MLYFAPHWDTMIRSVAGRAGGETWLHRDHAFGETRLFLLPSKKTDSITVYEAEFCRTFPNAGDDRACGFEYLGYYPHLPLARRGMHALARKQPGEFPGCARLEQELELRKLIAAQ